MHDKKLLYITMTDIFNINFGAAYTSNRNYKLLKKIINTDILIFSNNKLDANYLIPKAKNKFETFYYLILGRFGYNKKNEKKILKIIENQGYDYIFLDSSLLGGLCKKIKKTFPKIKIITFFHNIEYNFQKERARIEGKVYYLLWFIGYLNEKKSVIYSDKKIVLNQRENRELEKIYSKTSEYIIPLSFEDKFEEKKLENSSKVNYLFLGANFYSNLEGVNWFIENVIENLEGKLYVVGKNFEHMKHKLEVNNQVKVIGTVEKTDDWYYKKNIIVSPIFSGAGMKTKIAEALMFGKYIVGTTEAFEGYDIDYNEIGGICNSKFEFIEKIRDVEKKIVNEKYNVKSREYFIKKYSWETTEKLFRKMFDEI